MTGVDLSVARQILLEAIEERRGLIAYTKMQALEMDRLAREYERKALERLREELERAPAEGLLIAVRDRLAQMDEQLEALAQQSAIAEASRALQHDDITWRTFEEITALVGVEG